MGIPIFHIFYAKLRLWVLLRSINVPTINVLNTNIENINIFPMAMKLSIFTAEKNLCVLHGQVFII